MKALLLNLLFAALSSELSASDRNSLVDREGQSLAEKIRLASRAYLKLDLSDATQHLQSALDLVLEHSPYPTTKSDLATLASLAVVIAEDSHNEKPLLDPFPFRFEIEFQKNISQRLKDHWISLSRPALELNRLEGVEELYLSGERISLPIQLSEGRYLAHRRLKTGWEGGWLDVSNTSGIKFEKVHVIKPKNVLKTHLPFQQPPTSARPQPLAQPIGTAALKANPLTSSQQTNAWIQAQSTNAVSPHPFDPTNLDARMDLPGETPFYKKTWFWLIVGAAAGLGGYAAYEMTQSPTVIRTP